MKRVRLVIGGPVVARVAHIMFAVVGVIEVPPHDRSDGNSGGKGVGCGLEQFKRHVTAVRPAEDRDFRRIDEGLPFEPSEAGELIRDLDSAERSVGGFLKGGAPTLLPAIADCEHCPALLDEILIKWGDEAVGHVLRLWPAVDVNEYRRALAWSEHRSEQLIVKLGFTIGGGEAAKDRRDLRSSERRPRVHRIDAVFLNPDEALSGAVGQPDL